MDFSLGEVEKTVGELARRNLRERVTPASLKEAEKGTERFDRALWKELGGGGPPGDVAPGERGGLGPRVSRRRARSSSRRAPRSRRFRCGRRWCSARCRSRGSATDDQRRRWLDGVAAGETVLTAALVETGFDDAAEPGARARRVGGFWELHGAKICRPGGRTSRSGCSSPRRRKGGARRLRRRSARQRGSPRAAGRDDRRAVVPG